MKAAGTTGAGTAYTFTLQKNGANTPVTCTIAHPDTACQSPPGASVSLVSGDQLVLGIVTTGAPSNRSYSIGWRLIPTS